jgi:ribose 5-phosphate isomerase A
VSAAPRDPADRAKERAARRAAEYVKGGMRVGLGTGSTVTHLVRALAERRLELTCVATSERTRELAASLGLRVVEPDEVLALDLVIDGADEVDPALNLIKGGGGALTREKIVSQMTDRFIVVVDESKLVDRLGAFPLPLEILPFAPAVTAGRVRSLGAAHVRRREGTSDNGNLLYDAAFGAIEDPAGLATRLQAVPGLVEHGIFLATTVERVIVGSGETVRELRRS